MAAEIAASRGTRPSSRRFNEAAANGRGNVMDGIRLPVRPDASMRPRRMAAEMRRGRPRTTLPAWLQ